MVGLPVIGKKIKGFRFTWFFLRLRNFSYNKNYVHIFNQLVFFASPQFFLRQKLRTYIQSVGFFCGFAIFPTNQITYIHTITYIHKEQTSNSVHTFTFDFKILKNVMTYLVCVHACATCDVDNNILLISSHIVITLRRI